MKIISWFVPASLGLLFLLAFPDSSLAGAGDLYLSDDVTDVINQAHANSSNSTTEGPFATGLQHPSAICFDKAGSLFVDDSAAGKILKVAPDGTYTTFATVTGGISAMVFGRTGDLFVAYPGPGAIDYISPAGVVTHYSFGLTQPMGMAFDNNGNLYITEKGANVVTKYNTGGARSVFTSGLVAPTGLALGADGALYVVEQNGSLYKLAANGTKAATIATGFGGASALAIDASGNFYVAENAKAGFTKAITERITPSGSRTVFTDADQHLASLAIAPAGHLANISTRAAVQTGDNALIAGFIFTTDQFTNVVVRGIGPSLTAAGITNALQDPTLDLADSSGKIFASDDNWKDTQENQIASTGLAPTDNRESAYNNFFSSAACTAILRGKNSTVGTGLVEVYDVGGSRELANISTRSFVGTGDDVLIAGFIIERGQATLLIRALGPSLTAAGVNGALQDPSLVVRDANGFPVAFDNDWKQHQQAAIQATGLAPTDDREAASLITLRAGSYTATVSGSNNTTGIGLVEVYKLQ